MQSDIFICGICQNSFNALDQFILHKQSCQAGHDDVTEVNQGQGHFPEVSQSQGHLTSPDLVTTGQTDPGQQIQQQIDAGQIMSQITEQIQSQGQISIQGQTFEIEGQTYEARTLDNFDPQIKSYQTLAQATSDSLTDSTKPYIQNENIRVDFGVGTLKVCVGEAEEGEVTEGGAVEEGRVIANQATGMVTAETEEVPVIQRDTTVEEQVPVIPPNQIISIVDPPLMSSGGLPKIYQLQPLPSGGFELVPRPDIPVTSQTDEVTSSGEFRRGVHEPKKKPVFREPAPVKPKKKVGRPKRGEEKNKPPPKRPELTRLPLPERSSDGKFHCVRCQHSFTRDRHYNSHKCFGLSEIYADISKRVPGDEVGDDSPTEEDETRSEYTPDTDESVSLSVRRLESRKPSKPPTPPPGSNPELPAPPQDSNPNSADKLLHVYDPSEEANVATLPLISNEPGDPREVGIILEQINEETQEKKIRKVPEAVEEITFTEEEKQAFDRALNIDLGELDHMFKQHFIDQDVNQFAPVPLSNRDSHLSIFSCNTCDKVFKSQSQTRHHCLIHTNLRPFKCPKCDYATNAKGNLYTHMKKHLGWYFTCSRCPFKTVNRSHFVEHEATHDSMKTKCPVCKKNYSTNKSLINHLRRYHPDRLDDYCKKPRSIVGQAILHQCEICNRKFKKKIDRDRHLFMHNIVTEERTYECVLCDYSSHKKNLLEKHLWKHKFIYQCVLCPLKFLSETKLKVHLDSEHGSMDSHLFDECICKSLYLPADLVEGAPESLRPNLNIDEQCRKLLMDFEKSLPGGERERVVFEPMELAEIPTEALAGTGAGLDAEEAELDAEEEGLEPGEEGLDPEGAGLDPEALNRALEQTGSEEAGSDAGQQHIEESLGADAILDTRDSECWQIITRMGYLILTTEMMEKIRATFGDHECEHCGSRFWRSDDHDKHLLTHTNLRLYPCDECSYKSESKEYLRRHIARYHMCQAKYTCDVCPFVGTDKTEFWKHKMSHQKRKREMECPRCSSKFNPSALVLHVSQEHPDMPREEIVKLISVQLKLLRQPGIGSRTFQCPQCSSNQRSSSDLRRHLADAHGIEKQYGCPHCSYTCNNFHGLRSHLTRHSADKPYKCEVCYKGYKSRTAARWHARTHAFGRLFKCNKCPYEAIQKTHLSRHMETHLVKKRYRCHICDYSSNTSGYLRVHYTRIHKGAHFPLASTAPPSGPPPELPTRVYKCESCDFVFGNLYDIRRHMKTRHRVSEELVQFSSTEAELEEVEEATEEQLQPPYNALPIVYSEKDSDVISVNLGLTNQDIATPIVQATPTEDKSGEQAASSLSPSERAGPVIDLKAATAVSLLQELAGLQPGVLAPGQALQIQSTDGQILVVQQHGDDIIISTPDQSETGSQQYVIAPGQSETSSQQYILAPELSQADRQQYVIDPSQSEIGSPRFVIAPDQSETGNQQYVITYVDEEAEPGVEATDRLLNFQNTTSEPMEFTDANGGGIESLSSTSVVAMDAS